MNRFDRLTAIETILTIIHDEGNITLAQFVCDCIIQDIAGRVQAGVSEPDVDNLEIVFGSPPSGQNSAGSSPSASPMLGSNVPPPQLYTTPRGPRTAEQVSLSDSDDQFLA